MAKRSNMICYKTQGGVLKWIDKDLYNEIVSLQKRLEEVYGKKVSFRAASKIYVGFKNEK